MANKRNKKSKRPLPSRRKCFNRQQQLQSAKHWIPAYKGSNIVEGYRNHFGVDWMCAFAELEMLGIEIDPDYKEKVKTTLENDSFAKKKKKMKKQEEAELYNDFIDQDDDFAYIVGYTSGGFPYGITWEEYDNLPDSEKFLPEDADRYLTEDKSNNSLESTMSDQEDKLSQLILKASEMGADEIEIEYKDGYEEIIASKGGFGFGIDRLESNTDETMRLLKRIHELRKRKRITISGKKYKIQIHIYDSFGENAYRIKFQKI